VPYFSDEPLPADERDNGTLHAHVLPKLALNLLLGQFLRKMEGKRCARAVGATTKAFYTCL
jgi:hypothetical protein